MRGVWVDFGRLFATDPTTQVTPLGDFWPNIMNKLTPPRGYTQADTEARRLWLKEQTGHAMPEFALDEPDNLKGLIENHVGFVGLPQSVSGRSRSMAPTRRAIFMCRCARWKARCRFP